ncbi:MAG TPA: hypothetical protein QGF08_00950 [Candidatus Marinimicrobia bacterium]|jgi:hypothetical protein|nr:hypothetical protein [Candidatus Neomarinimicrobiota bacterium]MDP6276382.1 hypothetical protein [Candidatus Neomarinimicrobiota bacterium]MDP7329872.1 hypothetical protein [Candidatus Neomarinimicrobiota bacterium]MDP7436323.1 hypothetical protein [Candidatus Neomarinimicrobiota bacterium]HBN45653.1 hypothetical protein [Candidatus Neomarinimicrobiota bacterium]|tara:strand:+ start:10983 stop:11378 length:396 start_codon:yes stop_codon:yes gene_type:complete
MLEGIICPACENSLEEAELKESLSCPKCKTDLKNRKYLDFLEYLMTNGIVKDLDFFDAEVYSEDIEDLDQTEEEEVNPADFEKKKDTFSLYENEMVRQKDEEEHEKQPEYSEFEGLDEDWEEFNRREFGNV